MMNKIVLIELSPFIIFSSITKPGTVLKAENIAVHKRNSLNLMDCCLESSTQALTVKLKDESHIEQQ